MLTKLSIDLLYNALTEIQVTGSTEFAIIGNEETLCTLGKFAVALEMPNSSHSMIWNMPFRTGKVKTNSIVIAFHRNDRNTKIDDYSKALNNIIHYTPGTKFPEIPYTDAKEAWGLEISLS